jgi:TP901 family phage tail tape measure protein
VANGTKTLTYRIGADIGDLRRKMEEAGGITRAQQRELAALSRQQQEHRATIESLGRGFVTFGVAVTAGLALAGKAAMDWETAFTGVRKTVDGSDKEIAALEGELRKLARTLPATHEEIAGVAEAAGQLGIKRKDIAEFTKVMIDLGNTTNLTAEDAATGLAKLANIMGTSASDVDRLGSALVALGNDGASTEADILAMALRIAGAGKTIGISEASVLGFASALSSVGIEAEAGGSSISRVMVTIEQAVRSGGKAVRGFADVAGMSAEDFTKKYKDDAAGAIVTFIAGLSKMQKSGGDVFATLEKLGFGEIIVRDALLRAAGASDLFTKSLQVGSSAWAENNALAEEASKRYQTSASKLQVAGNQIKDSLIDVGAAIAPIAVGGAQAISDIVRSFKALPGPVQDVVTWVGVATAVVGLFGGAALIAVPKLLLFRESMNTMVAVGGGFSGALGKLGLFLTGPWGAALGAGAIALGLFGAASGAASRKQEDLAQAGKSVAQAISEQGGKLNASVRQAAAKEAQDKGLLDNAKKLKIELGSVTDAILQQGDAYDKLKKRLQDIVAAGTTKTNAGKSGTITTMTEEARAAQELLSNLNGVVDGKNNELAATKNTTEASKESTAAHKDNAKSAEAVAKSAEEAAKALDDLIKAFDKLNGVTLSFRDAQRDYVEAVQATGEALATNGKTLDINTKAGRENAATLDAQAKAANELAEAAAREAEKTGGAAAGAAAFKASLEATRPALIENAIKMGMSEEAARKYADSVLGIPAVASTAVLTPGSAAAVAELARVRDAVKGVPDNKEIPVGVLSAEAIAKLNELGFRTRTLPDGTVLVTGNTAPAQAALDTLIRNNQGKTIGIRVNVGGIDGLRIGGQNILSAYGNVVSFAGGGVWEDHKPQVVKARPGAVRVWAEPETDKETYIPWAMDRRPEAIGYLGYTADNFGYELNPKTQRASYNYGGFGGNYMRAPESQQAPVKFPSSFTLLDADGTLLGRMRLVADQAVSNEGRELYLRGGR